MADKQETIAAIATPPGKGGIGIVRISGTRCLLIAARIAGVKPVSRKVYYCAFKDHDGRIIDRGLLLYFQGPASYTGEDVIELHGHGGQLLLNILLERAIELGARPARPGEFTERAFLNDKMDLLQAEAVADLIDSMSERAARSAMRSLEGEFSESISGILQLLVDIRVFVEGALDFPEEDMDFLADSDILGRLEGCSNALEALLTKARNGRVLREGLRVAIVGRPNVGKSSLLNKLSQSDRAIVTAVPGTTRDVIEDSILIDGIYINIVDTAGIHEYGGQIEREGIKRSVTEMETADVILLVVENRTDIQKEVDYIKQYAPSGRDMILVHNKIDLHGDSPATGREKDSLPAVYLSAKTGAGLNLLHNTLMEKAGITELGEDIILARRRHTEALERAGNFIINGKHAFQETGSAEILADDLRQAQEELGSITGAFSADELLGEIFSSFCIGK